MVQMLNQTFKKQTKQMQLQNYLSVLNKWGDQAELLKCVHWCGYMTKEQGDLVTVHRIDCRSAEEVW